MVTSLAAAAALSQNPSVTCPADAASFSSRRGFAGASDHHHGPPKVNIWEDPMSPSKWKEEHNLAEASHKKLPLRTPWF